MSYSSNSHSISNSSSELANSFSQYRKNDKLPSTVASISTYHPNHQYNSQNYLTRHIQQRGRSDSVSSGKSSLTLPSFETLENNSFLSFESSHLLETQSEHSQSSDNTLSQPTI